MINYLNIVIFQYAILHIIMSCEHVHVSSRYCGILQGIEM